MKRAGQPAISQAGIEALNQYKVYLQQSEDMSQVTIRNYLSDLRQFIAWCEASWQEGQEGDHHFAPTSVVTPSLTRYRSHLQTVLRLKPASVNRALVSLKRYFAWATIGGLIQHDPSRAVKLVPGVEQAPRQLSDREEERLIASVKANGSLRDLTIIVLMLHTGLRAREVCQLLPADISIAERSGVVRVVGKRNKYREIPLNATARRALEEYMRTISRDSAYLFPSKKTGKALTERGLGYLVKRYASAAKLADVSSHDLRHRFGYRMAETVPLHRLAQIMGHDSLDTTMIYVRGTKSDLQKEVEKIAWE